MNKTVKISLVLVVIILLAFVLKYFKDANSKDIEDYKVEEPFYTSINTKAVATGKLNPEEQIELKPQISGIVDEILVEEGDLVKFGKC
jgi:HlyD family secretion protein